MKNFKTLLNKIALNNNKANADDFLTQEAPRDFYNRPACCDALYFWRSTDSNVQRFIELLDEVEDVSSDPAVRRDRIRALRPTFNEIYIQSVKNFVHNYCACNMQGGQQMVHHSEIMANLDCKTRINNLLQSKTNFQLLKEEISEQNIPALGGPFLDKHQTFIYPFADFAQFFTQVAVETLQTFGLAKPSSKNLKAFLDDLCKIKNSIDTMGEYGQILSNFETRAPNEIYSVAEFEALIENMLLSINSVSEAPERICAPVLDEETKSSLPAFGIAETTFVSCLMLVGLIKGRGPLTRVCRRLLGLNKPATAAAVAACAAATVQGTSTATVNPNDPALQALIGDVLDKTCSESGQVELFRCDDAMEGGEDAGGEVDAPGGGDVGAGGGLL